VGAGVGVGSGVGAALMVAEGAAVGDKAAGVDSIRAGWQLKVRKDAASVIHRKRVSNFILRSFVLISDLTQFLSFHVSLSGSDTCTALPRSVQCR